MDAPAAADPAALATLPYSFTTMWLAVQSTGLGAHNGGSRRVLVSGASGALGRLSLQLLSGWGDDVTAICDAGRCDEALMSGASAVVERGTPGVAALPAEFDVVLNFGAWESEATLVTKLRPGSLGHAMTVHPLLTNFDSRGWLRGTIANLRDWRAIKSAGRLRNASLKYTWTLFRPDRAALDVLEDGVRQGRFSLPIGIAEPLERADSVFSHVARGRYGRGVLLPWGART